MSARIPAQRGTVSLEDQPLPDSDLWGHECAVEGCSQPGVKRYFRGYTLTLCTADFIAAADQQRAEGRYW